MIDLSAWESLKPHPQQSALLRSPARLKAVAAGRGSGKTTVARRRSVMALCERKAHRRPMYFYALPTIKRAKRVAWPFIKELVPKDWLAAPLNNNMVVKTVFGSELYVVGLDDPTVIEGDQWDGGIIDEAADQKENWHLSVMPALSHRKGWLWVIGVPKRRGHGAPFFKKIYHDAEWESYTWKSDSVLPAKDIEWAKSTMSIKDYREQYEASWETAGGSAFYAFEKEHNVRRCSYNSTKPFITGSDFNVNPMAWVHAHRYDSGLEVFDETFIRDTNTRATLDSLWSRYGGKHQGGFWFYGDASGRARKTSASRSDYVQIQNDTRFKPVVRYPRANPMVKDRLAACNALFCNANGERKLHIDPSCLNLIEDLQSRALDDTGHPDDAKDQGHITDALGYIVSAMFPTRLDQATGQVRIGAVA